jgi:hypothetical protein
MRNRYHGKWIGRLCSITDEPGMMNEIIIRSAAISSDIINPFPN